MEGSVGSKQPVGDNGMKMGMKSGVIPESVDHHDHPQDAVMEPQHRAEEHLEALPRLRGHRLWHSGTTVSGASGRT
jgi:hypothetical protein